MIHREKNDSLMPLVYLQKAATALARTRLRAMLHGSKALRSTLRTGWQFMLLAHLAACTAATPPEIPRRRAGELMIEVGMRFQRARRAVTASAWELAAYDVHELREVFEDDLLPGKWSDNPSMLHEAHAFLSGPLLQLEASARVRDLAAWDSVFETTTRACNSCHAIGHVGFVAIEASGAVRISAP